MIRLIACAGVACLLTCDAFSQTAAARPEFDVASIRLNTSGQTDIQGGILPGGQFSVRNAPMSELIKWAFNIHDSYVDSYVMGSPGWFTTDRFDIVGKAPPNTPDDVLNLMLQSLLAQEFKLAFHQEQKPMNVYVLTVGKGGPKLAKAAGSGAPDCKPVGAQGPDAGGAHRACTNMSMAILADTLPDLAPGYFDRPVLDQTEIKGSFDFRLDWVGRRNVDQGGLTMFDALDKQLGIKAETRKVPMPIIVIDHVEKLAE